jgi:predicted PurR-regulated permease PerM
LGALGTVADFVLTLFLLFFFVRDGAAMLNVGRRLIPMRAAQRDELFQHLDAVTRAVVIGTGLTALIQGTLVGIAFAIVRLPSPVVFGVIAALLALLPIGGTGLVWVPAAIVLAVQGKWWQAIFMMIWGALLVSLVDNFVRPLLISGRAPVATLTVFIGVLGGVATFGMIGLFLGPVTLALVIALLRFAVTVRRRKEGEEVALS